MSMFTNNTVGDDSNNTSDEDEEKVMMTAVHANSNAILDDGGDDDDYNDINVTTTANAASTSSTTATTATPFSVNNNYNDDDDYGGICIHYVGNGCHGQQEQAGQSPEHGPASQTWSYAKPPQCMTSINTVERLERRRGLKIPIQGAKLSKLPSDLHTNLAKPPQIAPSARA